MDKTGSNAIATSVYLPTNNVMELIIVGMVQMNAGVGFSLGLLCKEIIRLMPKSYTKMYRVLIN